MRLKGLPVYFPYVRKQWISDRLNLQTSVIYSTKSTVVHGMLVACCSIICDLFGLPTVTLC